MSISIRSLAKEILSCWEVQASAKRGTPRVLPTLLKESSVQQWRGRLGNLTHKGMTLSNSFWKWKLGAQAFTTIGLPKKEWGPEDNTWSLSSIHLPSSPVKLWEGLGSYGISFNMVNLLLTRTSLVNATCFSRVEWFWVFSLGSSVLLPSVTETFCFKGSGCFWLGTHCFLICLVFLCFFLLSREYTLLKERSKWWTKSDRRGNKYARNLLC